MNDKHLNIRYCSILGAMFFLFHACNLYKKEFNYTDMSLQNVHAWNNELGLGGMESMEQDTLAHQCENIGRVECDGISEVDSDIRYKISVYGGELEYDSQLALTDSDAVFRVQFIGDYFKNRFIQVELNKETTALLRTLIDAMYSEYGSALIDNLPELNSYIRCSDAIYCSILFNNDDMKICETFHNSNVAEAYGAIDIDPFKKEYYIMLRLLSEIGRKLMDMRGGKELYYDETREKYFDCEKIVVVNDKGHVKFGDSMEFPRPTYYIREVIPIKDK